MFNIQLGWDHMVKLCRHTTSIAQFHKALHFTQHEFHRLLFAPDKTPNHQPYKVERLGHVDYFTELSSSLSIAKHTIETQSLGQLCETLQNDKLL
jgi:hypothetical protein